MRNKIYLTDDQIDYILSDYKNGSRSINKLKNEFGVDWKVIARVIKRGGLEIHGIRESRLKYFINESYFEVIDTENKAYWLGFIAADGCIRTDEKTFTLSLAGKDRGHLEKFLCDLDSNYLIYEHVKKAGNKEYPGVRVQVTNPTFCRGLINHGITPRKTETLEFPEISYDLERHFVRGLFDGDGCISGDNTCPSFSICGTKTMIEKAKEIVVPGSNIKLYARKHGMENFRDLKVGGRVQVEKIYHTLYDNSTIYLDRKKQIFENVIIKPNSKSGAINIYDDNAKQSA